MGIFFEKTTFSKYCCTNKYNLNNKYLYCLLLLLFSRNLKNVHLKRLPDGYKIMMVTNSYGNLLFNCPNKFIWWMIIIPDRRVETLLCLLFRGKWNWTFINLHCWVTFLKKTPVLSVLFSSIPIDTWFRTFHIIFSQRSGTIIFIFGKPKIQFYLWDGMLNFEML